LLSVLLFYPFGRSTEFPGITSNGAIADGVEVKLEAVSRGGVMVYSPDDKPCPRGEILVRRKGGLLVRPSYYWNRRELNSEAWTEDGWYRTGDIGELEYRVGSFQL
jgi:long-chain acyl-CoA synthetase